MPVNFKALNWQSLCEYLKEDHDTPIPVYGSNHCVLIVRPSMGLELQMRDDASFCTEIASLPSLTRFLYEKSKTADYSYLAIKCETPDLLEAVLDFFYSIASNMVERRKSARDAIVESYEQYKAILNQPLTASEHTLKGLWGELYVLRMVLGNPCIEPDSIVLNWTGPQGQPNDFSFGKTAIEVKTITKQTNVIEISSFDQLDADRCWLIIIHAFNASPENGGTSIGFLASSIGERLTAAVRDILHARIDAVLNSLSGPSTMSFAMKPDGFPVIVEICDSIPLLTRSKLNSLFGESRAGLILKGKYVLDLSSVEFTRKKIDEVFCEAQRYGISNE